MTPSAKYGISATIINEKLYASNPMHHEFFRVHGCEDGAFSDDYDEKSRNWLIKRATSGLTVVTIQRSGSNDEWTQKGKVGLVDVDGDQYVRTDAKKRAKMTWGTFRTSPICKGSTMEYQR